MNIWSRTHEGPIPNTASPGDSPTRPARRHWLAVAGATALIALSGCAALNTIHVEVKSYGSWPAGRTPGSYSFERLPSQQDDPDQAQLEALAADALKRAGFTAAAPGTAPQVTVQIGANVNRQDSLPWNEPLWWNSPRWGYPGGGPYYWPNSSWWAWNTRYERTTYVRQVALLIRDAKGKEPLFESHAVTEGVTYGGPEILGAMFRASLDGFPKAQPEGRTVGILLGEP